MIAIPTTYNERSWAIDLIGYLKQLSTETNRSIKDVGGEQTIRVDGGSLFPDVLLFGDRTIARILQGWELKMPDTRIDDNEFITNATIKAKALGLDSFLLWNVSKAYLYVRNAESETYYLKKEWVDLVDITTRSQVYENVERWKNLAKEIFLYLNDLFDRGVLEGRQFIEAYKSGGVTALIMENTGEVSIALIEASRRNVRLRSEMILWWNRYKAEYGQGTMEIVLARAIISNWIGKIIFAQILREQDSRAMQISSIADETTPLQALAIFSEISESCNFWTIFSSDSIGLELLSDRAWNQLKQFNQLLNDLRIGAVDQSQLSGILEATVEVATRKLRGQYPTPIELARLLVNLCLQDIVNDKILDPCCGSGTIARAALEKKLASGGDIEIISKSIYAGDQDPQAVQIATFALAKPSLMHMPLRIFQKDAFTLKPDVEITYRDPSDGSPFTEVLGQFHAIASNLPFVAQEGREQYGNAISEVTRNLTGQFSRRADVSAYLPFALHSLLHENGRLGIIITNAWLGTDWGDAFYENLIQYYKIQCVVTSGAGRWFQNSQVVTNILILEKCVEIEDDNEVKFVVLTRPLEEFDDEESVQITAAQIELGQTQNDTMTIRSVTTSALARFRVFGLGGNAQFVNCDWILELPLCPLNNLFEIRRGERRGMNSLFYPNANHGIESEYIKPLAKSPTDFVRLKYSAIKEAFSCSLTEDELRDLNHTGALQWIERFKTTENITKLSKPNNLWYEMKADQLTDLVLFINYFQRIFAGRVDPPAFVDQRLIRLSPRIDLDIELLHAILNCSISLFIIEGMGFGRGAGALDLSKDRIEEFMHILNPELLSEESILEIKRAFIPLLNRDILEIADELEQPDRQFFDETVIRSFNLNVDRNLIYDSLLSLVEIRLTANT